MTNDGHAIRVAEPSSVNYHDVVAIGDNGDCFVCPGHSLDAIWVITAFMQSEYDMNTYETFLIGPPRFVWLNVEEANEPEEGCWYSLMPGPAANAEPYTMIADWSVWRIPT